MTTRSTDTIKDALAELLGKKASGLTITRGVNLTRSISAAVAEAGFTVTQHRAQDTVRDKHLVLYSDVHGETQATVSDHAIASAVKVLSRLTVEKADAKAGATESA